VQNHHGHSRGEIATVSRVTLLTVDRPLALDGSALARATGQNATLMLAAPNVAISSSVIPRPPPAVIAGSRPSARAEEPLEQPVAPERAGLLVTHVKMQHGGTRQGLHSPSIAPRLIC
jgi:hypothetical protein